VLTGSETELDKSMVEKITDPPHAHREERDRPPASSRRTGASAASRPRPAQLNAYHDSAASLIEVADDGGGLDHKKDSRRRSKRGLLAPGHTPSDERSIASSCSPGLHGERGDHVSGRGVGMDVVRRNIESRAARSRRQLRGSGHDVSMRLPLTLAINRGVPGRVDRSYVVRSRWWRVLELSLRPAARPRSG